MDLSLDQFYGIVSLLLACLELVLLINLLVFAEKNYINRQLMLLVVLLCLYQFLEFIICYFEAGSQLIIYLALLTISLLPPLGLKISLSFRGFRGRIVNLVFLPALFFIFYFPAVMEELAVTKCTVLYAILEYPLGDLYGVFYFLPILLTIILLYLEQKKREGADRRLVFILFLGFSLTFLPAGILIVTLDTLWIIKESFLCKLAIILAVAASYVAIMYKEDKKGE